MNRYSSMYRNIHQAKGFTLVELLITISIMAIIAALAAPSMGDRIAEMRLKNAMDVIYSCFRESRITAATVNQEVLIKFIPQNNGPSSLICGDSEIVLDPNITLTLGSGVNANLTFKPDGTVWSGGSMIQDANGGYQLCYDGYDSLENVVHIDPKGQVSTFEGTQTCQ